MDENITQSVRETLRDQTLHKGLVVDTQDGGHLIVKDVFVSTGFRISERSELDSLLALDVIDESGEPDVMLYGEFKDRRVSEMKTCNRCGSSQIVSYDRSGTVGCKACGRVFTGGNEFEDTIDEMVEEITVAAEIGEFEDRDMARWRITEWYLDEIGVETIHEESEFSDDEIHLNEYETASMSRERFREEYEKASSSTDFSDLDGNPINTSERTIQVLEYANEVVNGSEWDIDIDLSNVDIGVVPTGLSVLGKTDRTVKVSKSMWERSDWETVKETVRHELVHVWQLQNEVVEIDGQEYEVELGHDGCWDVWEDRMDVQETRNAYDVDFDTVRLNAHRVTSNLDVTSEQRGRLRR